MARISKFAFQYTGFQQLLLEICVTFSVICLTISFIVYAFIPELRNIPGKNLMSLTGVLIVTHISYLISFNVSIQPNNVFCVASAIIRHYAFLTAFTWMSVLAYDVYHTFNSPNGKSHLREKNTFAKYCIYSYSMPALIVGISCIIEFTDSDNEKNRFRPMYGYVVCGISQCEPLLLFFALPVGLILFINAILFIKTSCKLKKTTDQTGVANNSSLKVRFGWYIKLSLILGVSWIFSFIGSLIESLGPLVFISIISIALKGAFIFFAFTCKRSVYRLIIKRLKCFQKTPYDRYSSFSSYQQNHKISKV